MRLALCASALAISATSALAQQSAVVDLAGVQLRNGVNQSRTSAGTITPAFRYHTTVDGMVRGQGGALGILFPAPVPLAQVLETLAPGSGITLSGEGDNCTGQHPFGLPSIVQSGSTVLAGITVNYAFTIDTGINAGNQAYFNLYNVTLSPSLLTGYLVFTSGAATVTRVDFCPANCDNSTSAPVLNVLDFNCFLNKFTQGDPAANCDCSTGDPTLNVLDFNCFINRFNAGCQR